MPARFEYRRLTHAQFDQALQTAKISAREFAKLTGMVHRRVGEWLSGEQDIPPWVMSYMALLTLPGAVEMARAVAAETIVRDNENMHLGDYPFKSKEARDAA